MTYSLLYPSAHHGLIDLAWGLQLVALVDTFPAISGWSLLIDAQSRSAAQTLRSHAADRCRGISRSTGFVVAGRRSYTQTLQRLTHAAGADRSMGTLDGADVETAVQSAWGHCAPATWNRRVATVRSFIAFCRRHGWLAEDAAGGLDRRREPADRTRTIPRAELERPCEPAFAPALRSTWPRGSRGAYRSA
jgi:hypothetical protein